MILGWSIVGAVRQTLELDFHISFGVVNDQRIVLTFERDLLALPQLLVPDVVRIFGL